MRSAFQAVHRAGWIPVTRSIFLAKKVIMKAYEFCYWLQGYFELVGASSNREPESLTEGQIETIKNHLNMVFLHDIDKSYPQGTELNHLHQGKKVHGFDPQNTVLRC